MHQRGFNLTLAILGAWALGGLPVEAEAAAKAQPNVVFIVCDDLNHYVLHGRDAPQARTPNLDRLAKQGVTFANNHAVTPVRGPSRTCVWTGVYPQWHGNYNLWKWDLSPVPQLTKLVRASSGPGQPKPETPAKVNRKAK